MTPFLISHWDLWTGVTN